MAFETKTLKERLLPLIVLAFTSIISVILICTRNYRNIGGFFNVVENDRASTALVVQVLSSVLGLMQIFVATSIFNFTTRIWVTEHPITLGILNLWTAIQAPKADLSLSIRGYLLAIAILAASQGPGALWAGALTPVLTTVTREGGIIPVPAFTESTMDVWNNQFGRSGVDVLNNQTYCNSTDTELGFISNCPVPDLQGSLLNSGGSATTLSGAARNHSKIDNPSWSFKGRSYGVASSEGIESLSGIFSHRDPLSYSYTQAGYNTLVTCDRNLSSEFTVGFIDTPDTEPQTVTVWEIRGALPNSVPGNFEFYPTITWFSSTPENVGADGPDVLGWAGVVNPEANERNMIAIAAGGESYKSLNQTQCSVTFKPQNFEVSVNTTEQTIIVTPLSDNATVIDIEPTGTLMDNTMWSLNLLSRMTPSLYESVLGDTLEKNVANLQARPGLNMTPEEATLSAISDSFTAILEDILVAFGSAQLAMANSSIPTPVTGILPAVQIGQDLYIFATAGVNAFLVLLVVVEAARTKFWHKLPVFDYTNIKTMIVAASAGRGSIAREVALTHTAAKAEWDGGAKDKMVDEIRVQLVQWNPTGDVELVLQVAEQTKNVDSDIGLQQTKLLLGNVK
jgi:hypothetical protein